jgi:hypothetical protein
LNIIQTKVRKFFGEKIVIDKNMKEHRWKYRKYTIIIDDDQNFTDDESTQITCNNDFEEITHVIKGLKNDVNYFNIELNDIKMENNEQKAFVKYLKGICPD